MYRSKEYAGDYERKRTVMNKAQEETTFSFQKKKVKFMYTNGSYEWYYMYAFNCKVPEACN